MQETQKNKQAGIDAILEVKEFITLSSKVSALSALVAPAGDADLSRHFNAARMPVQLVGITFDHKSNSPHFHFISSDNKNMRVSLDYSQASMLSNALDDVSKETPIIEYNKAQLELANAFDGVRVAAKKSSDGVPSELIADAQNGRLYIEKLINFMRDKPINYPVVLPDDHHRAYTKYLGRELL